MQARESEREGAPALAFGKTLAKPSESDLGCGRMDANCNQEWPLDCGLIADSDRKPSQRLRACLAAFGAGAANLVFDRLLSDAPVFCLGIAPSAAVDGLTSSRGREAGRVRRLPRGQRLVRAGRLRREKWLVRARLGECESRASYGGQELGGARATRRQHVHLGTHRRS